MPCAPRAPTIGRDPATLRVTEEAVLALVARREQIAEARALAERRFAGPGWGFAAGGYCGTPDDIVARIRAPPQLGVDGFIFFLHDRGEPETLRLLAKEVLPALRLAARHYMGPAPLAGEGRKGDRDVANFPRS